jgi:predicted GNAT family N-acyltransferase
MDTFSIAQVQWQAMAGELAALRHAVFVVEQGVPVELEVDELDPLSVHALARSQAGEVVGTARLTPDGRIGRMAVAKAWRRRGVGRALLEHLVDLGRARGLGQLNLHAQTHAVDFYARAGFVRQGAVFMDAGIPHVTMVLRSDPDAP